MMPSRGIQVARGKIPRICQIRCRNLSSTPRSNLRIASHTRSSIARTSTAWARPKPIAIPSIAALRYASTAPAAQQTAEAAAAAAATTVTPPPESTTSFANLDTINLDTISIDPSTIRDKIGYLKEVGIDFGIGPTSLIQWVLEHSHIYGGLPWWASIIATGVLMRIAMFPLYLRMSDSLARMQALSSVTKPFYERMNKAKEDGNTGELMQSYQQINAIHKRAGISMRSQYLPMAVQAVVGYCGFRLMRAMVTLPVPGLKEGGFLWITDLTMTDGYLLLPTAMAVVLHLVGRIGGEAGASAQIAPQMQKFMKWGMPVMVFIFTAIQPGAVALWFVGTGAVGLAQSQLLKMPSFRRFWNLAPLYKPAPGEGVEGGMMGAMMGKSWQQAQERATARASTAAYAGKSASISHASYQSPNIHTPARSKTIDAQLVDKSAAPQQPESDMVQPQKKGIFDGITNKAKRTFADAQAQAKAWTEKTEEQKKKALKADFKKRADAYEKRASQRQGR